MNVVEHVLTKTYLVPLKVRLIALVTAHLTKLFLENVLKKILDAQSIKRMTVWLMVLNANSQMISNSVAIKLIMDAKTSMNWCVLVQESNVKVIMSVLN